MTDHQDWSRATSEAAMRDVVAREDRWMHRAEPIQGERPTTRWAGDPPSVESVPVTMTYGELSVLGLGLSEKSTHAQRVHAREVMHGYVVQAFDAIADEVIHRGLK